MGKRGPLPLNREERWLRGSTGPRPVRKRQQPPLKMPGGLSENEQRVWRRVVPKLATLGVLGPADATALADLCTCVGRLAEAEAAISKHGLLVEGANGVLVKNPACTLARQYRTALQAWAGKFGLTPADRLRLEVEPEEEPEDELERLLRGPEQQPGHDPREILRSTQARSY